MPLGDSDLGDFINNWLQTKQTSGFINKLYMKWVLGKSDEQEKRRWSFGRNIFGLWE
jgi:hypothetical protein